MQSIINQFTDNIFGARTCLKYAEYNQVNQLVSSEMFYSIMRVLHEKLPCTKNFFRMKKQYREKISLSSPLPLTQKLSALASQKMVQGLALT